MFVKICGITRVEDGLAAADSGADAIGMIFTESKRQISVESAKKIIQAMPDELLTIGVFKNADIEQIVELANQIGLDGVQLHGDETAKETVWATTQIKTVIKAFRFDDPNLAELKDYAPAMTLIDSTNPGSGETFDWAQVNLQADFILAGGLSPENVSEAITKVRPWGVDISTGVESSPGIKDHQKITAFIQQAKGLSKL